MKKRYKVGGKSNQKALWSTALVPITPIFVDTLVQMMASWRKPVQQSLEST
ncbi:hypothetical protein KHA80_07605 [Anaerobacillus sp. HL2]|nr:hypothetical protein KHA80_07605 [Anaerobacillus sp. HL2]